ncbi:MAG TPA: hypothetical protein VJO13_18030 [Ktedonobacterales bacterium]|nr:hypothetical protein [Ktedonobacterales bacterium]
MNHLRLGTPSIESAEQSGALRCAICARRLGSAICYLEETGDVPPPRQSWMLCTACNDAVKQQMAEVPIHSPIRLRVAIGVVSTERSPAARRARRGQLTDKTWFKLFFWGALITMLFHLALIVAIAGIAK